jgi:DNA adenine methylase
MSNTLKAPFPYFGAKSRIAGLVWSRLGNVRNYVEPFFGSGAVLLGRPQPFDGKETVNDLDGLLTNFWRGIQFEPNKVAAYANYPISELDMTARHAWLVACKPEIVASLKKDSEWYDAKAAGWWVWGMGCSIGNRWSQTTPQNAIPHLGGSYALHAPGKNLQDIFDPLTNRLRYVRICCGDWSRVCSRTPTFYHGLTGVFLDPPYNAKRSIAYTEDDFTVSTDVREWAIEVGKRDDMRIALCGYEGEHDMPSDWSKVTWKTAGGWGRIGYGKGIKNKHLERVWFSPTCIKPVPTLF